MTKLINKEWYDFSNAFKYFEETILPTWKRASFYPLPTLVFRAFNECPLHKTKVVILGQDPYFDGSAVGLCFDNSFRVKKVSASLRNILKEMANDIGPRADSLDKESYFEDLPAQGVLLINTALTVEPNKAGSHTEIWKPFTNQLIADLQSKDNIVWILWGNHAKSFKPLITNNSHHILEGTHPMPLAANRGGFFGKKYFSKANTILEQNKLTKINW
jgi:uracil-DNA glycosylase